MNSRQSFLAGIVTTAAVVMFYMENIFDSPTVYDVKTKYVEVEIPAKKPNFTDEVKTINSSLNKSKLKHLLIYTFALCEEYKVPYTLVKAVITTESSWNHKAVSKSDARGLMQIKPSTSMSEFKTPGGDLFDPYVNITVGIKYLSQLHERFGDWNTTLTAYSHGPTITSSYSSEYIASNFYVKKIKKVQESS
tara:strand:+ start:1111 stop:1686 length:576 start_codon:yes stop_codon:yes gene_type:complete